MDKIEYIEDYNDLSEKTILAFVTYVDHEDKIILEKEIYGDIVRVSETGGFEGMNVHIDGEVWERENGETKVKYKTEFCLPFADDNYWYADEGEYKLILSKQNVPNPDILSTWRVKRPKN